MSKENEIQQISLKESTRSVMVTISNKLASKILIGEKQIEFRKVWPRLPIHTVWFCEKGSRGQITLCADVRETLVIPPAEAWRKFREISGVSENEFFQYSGVRETVYCIALANISRVHDTFLETFNIQRPPQNYIYIDR